MGGGHLCEALSVVRQVYHLSTLSNFIDTKIIFLQTNICSVTGYSIPKGKTIAEYHTYIDNLPLVDTPEVMGLHPNADITYQVSIKCDDMIVTIYLFLHGTHPCFLKSKTW